MGAAFGLAAFSMTHLGPIRNEEEAQEWDEQGLKHKMIGGVMQPPFMQKAVIDELQDKLVLRDSDIIIASYPKCGTTWMQQILLTLLFEGDKSKVPRPMAQAPWIEAVASFKRLNAPPNHMGRHMTVDELAAWDGSTEFAPASPRRVFKTHLNVELLPWKGGLKGLGKAKVVLVTRNPKDACVSLFHHARDSQPLNYRGDFQHFTSELFLKGNVISGCFWAFHSGWEEAAESTSGVIWVSYEELKRDPAGAIRRLAKFLEIPMTEETLSKTIAGSSFSAMKQSFAEADAKMEAAGVKTKRGHLRKGEMGSWRNDIDGALLVQFEAVHALKSIEHGLRYRFDFG